MMNNISPGVLITSAGRRVELTQFWKKSLFSFFGSDSFVFTTDLDPLLSAACQISDKSFKVCRATEPEYITQILSICLDCNISLVVPTIDTELQVFADSRELFAAYGVHILVSDSDFVSKCRDKRLTSALFASLSIPTPKILDPSRLSFPCFMKPLSGSCSQGIKAIHSPDDLSKYDLSNPDNLFQELVPCDWSEYTVDLCYSQNGDLLGCVPRQRLEVRGGETSKGVTRKNYLYKLLKSKLKNIKGARGVLSLQVFVSPMHDHILGIEINPRFGGGYPISHAAGASYPSILIRDFLLREPLRYHEDWQEDMLGLRHDSMIVQGGFTLNRTYS